MSDHESPAVRRFDDWDAARLRALADECATPLYVVDLDRVRENYRRIDRAFPDATVHYAAKANASRAVLETLRGEGAGIECASAGEVHRALDAGVDGSDILYTAVNPPAEDLDYAVEVDGITITVGAEDTVDRLAERGYDGRLCVRVNPGVGAGHHPHVRTGSNPKFGVPLDRAADLLAEADAAGFEVVGVHAHAGSGISDEDLTAHRELVSRMGELVRDVPISLEFVDVGGGFGVPYRPEEEPLNLDRVAAATREALGDVDADLHVEPGRFVVADAGVLLTRVNTVKEADGTTVVGVDAGMTTLLRPALYDAYHHVWSLAPDADERAVRTATVAGPICESADVFGTSYDLPEPSRRDLLAVGNAGAYGEEMASQYNSRPRPATVAVDGDRTAVVREGEAFETLLEREREVPWL